MSDTDRDSIIARVRRFILEEFLPGEDPEDLTDSMPLISGGILDSIKNMRLIGFLEEEYGVAFEAHEISFEFLDTLELITSTVQAKLAEKK